MQLWLFALTCIDLDDLFDASFWEQIFVISHNCWIKPVSHCLVIVLILVMSLANEDFLQGVETPLWRLLPTLARSRNEEPIVVDSNGETANLVNTITLFLIHRFLVDIVGVIFSWNARLSLHPSCSTTIDWSRRRRLWLCRWYLRNCRSRGHLRNWSRWRINCSPLRTWLLWYDCRLPLDFWSWTNENLLLLMQWLVHHCILLVVVIDLLLWCIVTRCRCRHWNRLGESSIRVEDLSDEKRYPSRRLVTGSIHKVTFGFDTWSLLNRLSEVSFMRNLDNVFPYTCQKQI